MDLSRYASFSLLLFTVSAIQNSANETLLNTVESWICPFDKDFCGWKVGAAETVHPVGPLVDIGWRIFSPHSGDELNPGLNISSTSRFAFLETQSELRSEISSPAGNISEGLQKTGVLLSFSYFRTEGASLILYQVVNSIYKVLWVSGDLDLLQELPVGNMDSWFTTSVCLPLDYSTQDKNQVMLSFVGHVLPNSSIGLQQFKATVGVTACISDEIASLPNPSSTESTDKAHVAWKVLVVLSLFLCFGALFLATIVIVFGGFKNKLVRKNTRGHSSRRRISEGQFVNPVGQFDYQRLQDM